MCALCGGRHMLRNAAGRFVSHPGLSRIRDEWSAYVESMITSAEDFTRGHMLTIRGWARGVSVRNIITRQSRGHYASAELREWLRTHRVVPWSEYVSELADAA